MVLEAHVGSGGGELDYSSSEVWSSLAYLNMLIPSGSNLTSFLPGILCQVSQAIEDVRTPGSSMRWVVFGYEGNTGRLKVVEVAPAAVHSCTPAP